MVGAQLDVIDQDIFFIRPDTLQQLVPSLNQYFKYAEMLVNGNNNRASMGGTMGRPPMQTAANLAQQRLMNGQMQNNSLMGPTPGNTNVPTKGSPMMSPAMMANSPNFRPNAMNSPQLRGVAPQQMNTQLAQNLQTLAQQITMYQGKHTQLQQNVVQIQNMRQTPNLSQENQQNLQLQQQELMKQQQGVSLALNQLSNQYRLAMDQMKNVNAIANQQRAINNQQQMAQMHAQSVRTMANGNVPLNMMNQSMGVNPSFQTSMQNSPQMQDPTNLQMPGSNLNVDNNNLSNFGSTPQTSISQAPFAIGENLVADIKKPASPLAGKYGEPKNSPVNQDLNSTNLAIENFGFGSESFMNTFHQQKDESRQISVPTGVETSNANNTNPESGKEKPPANWEDQLNFGSEGVLPVSKDEGFIFLNLDQLEDFFNFDYQPPALKESKEFDAFVLDPTAAFEDDDLADVGKKSKDTDLEKEKDEASPEELGEPETAKKRARDSQDEEDLNIKKPKAEEKSILVKELEKISSEHNVTYTIKNTPSKTSSSAILISFALEEHSFALSIRNKSLYERGLSKGLVSFSTTESPDNLTELVANLCSPTSNARINDVVAKIVEGINNKIE